MTWSRRRFLRSAVRAAGVSVVVAQPGFRTLLGGQNDAHAPGRKRDAAPHPPAGLAKNTKKIWIGHF